MFSYLKEVWSKLSLEDTFFSSSKKDSRDYRGHKSSNKEEIIQSYHQNHHVIQEKEIARWIIEKELFFLKMIYENSFLEPTEEDVVSFSKFASIVMTNELVNGNRNTDFTNEYQDILQDYIKIPDIIIENGSLPFILELISQLVNDTRLLAEQLKLKKSADEWDEIWDQIKLETGISGDISKEPCNADDFVKSFIRQKWHCKESKKVD